LIREGFALKFLLTGGAGFVGSHLLDQLVNRGDSVVVLDDFSTGRKENIAHHSQNKAVEVVEGSILDADLVEKLVSKSDRVLHLAAAVGVFNIVRHPLESLTTNIKGSENVFEACLKNNKPVLLTSSSEIYGKNTADRLSEESDRIVGPPQKIRWSYSDAKAIDEAMVIALHQQKGLETRIVRLFNTVGPRQIGRYGMVVPRFVEAALENKPIEIYGSGEQTRCFGHVLDVVQAILMVDGNKETIGCPINIGSSQEISIRQLADKVIEITHSSSVIHNVPYDHAYGAGFEDMERRIPNTDRLQRLTGWAPKLDISNIINDCVAEKIISKLPE
jgi:UDP-glucose 4-epimerase